MAASAGFDAPSTTDAHNDAKRALVQKATTMFRDFANARAKGRLGLMVELNDDFHFHALLMALKSAYKFNIALPHVFISDAREDTPLKAEEHRVWATVIPGWHAVDACPAPAPPTPCNAYDRCTSSTCLEVESAVLVHQASRVAEEIAIYKREHPNPYPSDPTPQPTLAW